MMIAKRLCDGLRAGPRLIGQRDTVPSQLIVGTPIFR